jgi:nucleoside-diphosphate-sugar epimerase
MIDALLAAANSTAPSGSVYNVVDSADLDQGEVSRILRKLSNGKIRPIFLPYPFVWAMMFGIDLISLVRNRQLGTARFRLKRTLADMRFKCNAAKDELGWQPRVPFSEGLSRVFETTMKSDNR